jgi:hypothetical protein
MIIYGEKGWICHRRRMSTAFSTSTSTESIEFSGRPLKWRYFKVEVCCAEYRVGYQASNWEVIA